MVQPTKKELTEKIYDMLNGKLSREYVAAWAFNYITNDEETDIDDIDAWHYLVEISSVDLMAAPGEYLFDDDDIIKILKKYDQ